MYVATISKTTLTQMVNAIATSVNSVQTTKKTPQQRKTIAEEYWARCPNTKAICTRRFSQSKTYYLMVGDRVFKDTNLSNLQRKKHNYKTSPHFKDTFISPIFDNNMKENPLWLFGGNKLWPHRQGK